MKKSTLMPAACLTKPRPKRSRARLGLPRPGRWLRTAALLLYGALWLADLPAQAQPLAFLEITVETGAPGDTLSLAVICRQDLQMTGLGLSITTSPDDLLPLAASSMVLTAFNAQGMSFAWHDGAFGPNRFLLNPGTYTVTATNQFGCAISRSISVPRQNALHVPADFQPVLDCRIPSTSIQLAPPRNGPGIAYFWSDQSTQKDLPDIGTGGYSVTVQDSQTGCIGSRNFSIQQSPMLISAPI
jgi:hypothetical protein